ncbi:hypothetical protein [Halorussus caseinilyticus]|uniref:DUF8123 domain-containing protein n=1 Tax=Halorussus caseinilyticus TaxID=3034025 RepID=A0ABD5WMZ1_9EURY|nr:hypothetical protein [Halorussus sp. DT72]
MATANADRLEPLGIGFGVLLVLIGLATIVGTPWAYKSGGILVLVGQALGAVAAIAVGAGLAWVARN